MSLFFEGFQPQNSLILLLFSMKHSYRLMAKVTPDVNNTFWLGILGIKTISTLLLGNIKLYTTMEHPITSQKMTFRVFKSIFVVKYF